MLDWVLKDFPESNWEKAADDRFAEPSPCRRGQEEAMVSDARYVSPSCLTTALQ